MPLPPLKRMHSFSLALFIVAGNSTLFAQDAPAPPPASQPAPQKRGVVLNSDAAAPGYLLYAPLRSTTTYLVDSKGEVAHTWPSKYTPGASVYLLEDGSILRCGREPGMGFGPGGPGGPPGGGAPGEAPEGEAPRGPGGPARGHFMGGGIGGHVERISVDGKVLWDFKYDDDDHCLHHDICPLPNGHVLMIAWEKKSKDEAIAAGRDPATVNGAELWPDTIIEVEPQGDAGGKIVWQWHTWDHLVQDTDKNKPNYGVIANHPERIDINFRQADAQRPTAADQRRLRALGYVGGDDSDDGAPASRPARRERENGTASQPDGDNAPGPRGFGPGGRGGPDMQADWLHTNSIDYNAKLDQIVLSIHNFSEIWIIDHSTTTAEAATSKGGKSGHGGDLLYRWGNPRAYGAGSASDQQLFAQHDARWIPAGLPGAGNITVFNNGMGRPDGRYSSIVEITPPVDAAGHYTRVSGKPFGPEKPAWEYVAPKKDDFFASHISGAQRLPNGDTFICNGEEGRMFEVTSAGKITWDYLSPRVTPDGGPGGFRGPGRGGPGGFGPDNRGGPQTSPRPRRAEGGQPDDQRPGNFRPDGPPPGGPGRAGDDGGRDPRPRGDGPPGGPGGFGGPGGRGRGGPGGGPGGVFRATHLPPDHAGVIAALKAHRITP